jgi:hypothetical protein
MCHYNTNRCKLCHAILSSAPINCGHGMAILGPFGMTIECARDDLEVVEETKICIECIEKGDASEDEEKESGWDKWISWSRRKE